MTVSWLIIGWFKIDWPVFKPTTVCPLIKYTKELSGSLFAFLLTTCQPTSNGQDGIDDYKNWYQVCCLN